MPEEWKRISKKLKEYNERSLVVIIGGTDTGKSSLARFLFDQLYTKSYLVSLIDADLGQASVGPPATVGLAISKDANGEFHPFRLRFVGSVSPRNQMLQTVVAVKKLIEEAITLRAKCILIDTSGFIGGAIGREFKFQKIDLINPTHIIALENENELKSLLKNILYKKGISIFRMKAPVNLITPRTPDERRLYRAERFRAYLKGAQLVTLPLNEITLLGFVPDLNNKQEWENLLIGINDRKNNMMSLGVIKNIDLKKGIISFITPLDRLDKTKIIRFGSIYINETIFSNNVTV